MLTIWDGKKTWLHHVNPSCKLIVLFLSMIAVIFIHDPNALVNLAFMLFALFLFSSGYSFKQNLLLLLPFSFLFISTASSMILFGKGEITWWKWGWIHVTQESFYRGIHIGFRALIYALLGLLFTLTTRPVLLFYSLMQQLRLKPSYAYSFLAGFRLLPIMLEEFETIRQARLVRGAVQKNGIIPFFQRLKTYALPLLSQSIRRAQRIAVAMEVKRFSNAKKRTYYYQLAFSKYDAMFVILFAILFGFAIDLAYHFPYFPVTDVRSG